MEFWHSGLLLMQVSAENTSVISKKLSLESQKWGVKQQVIRCCRHMHYFACTLQLWGLACKCLHDSLFLVVCVHSCRSPTHVLHASTISTHYHCVCNWFFVLKGSEVVQNSNFERWSVYYAYSYKSSVEQIEGVVLSEPLAGLPNALLTSSKPLSIHWVQPRTVA